MTTAQLMVKVGADVSQALSGLRQVSDNIGGLASNAGSKLKTIGDDMMGVGTKATAMALPVTLAMAQAIRSASEFESQMNVLEITMRQSGVTGEQWSEVALKIGADSDLVGVSASDAAQAITDFGKAGLDVNQIMGDYQSYLAGSTELTGALRAAVDLAAASELDLAGASQAIVQTMNQYGLSFDDASTVMDNFIRTADASTASVGDLVEAHENVGPVMAQMGFSVEEANVQLAILADRGIIGAEAGTTLKSMWLNMTNPATKAADALAALNINLYDASGTMRDSQSVIGDLSSALAGLSDEQRNLYLQQLAGSYGIKALNILIEEGSIGWEEYETAIAGATSMQEQAAARTEGFHAAMEQFKGVVETFMITAATPFIQEFLTPFLQKAGEFLQKLMEVHPEFAKWAFVIAGLIVVVGPLLLVVGGMISAIGTIITVVGGAIGIFSGLGGAIAAAAAAISVALGPVLLIIAAVAVAVLALKLAWETNFLGIRDILQGAWDSIKEIFGFIKGAIKNFMAFLHGEITWDGFVDKTRQAFENLKTSLERIWIDVVNKVREKWEEATRVIIEKVAAFIAPLVGGMDKARETVTAAFGHIGEFLTNVWDGIKAAIFAAWEYIQGVISGAIDLIRGVLAVALQIISGDWSGAWESIKATVVSVWDSIQTGIGNALNIIGPRIKAAWEDIRSGVTEKVEMLKTSVAEKWEAMKSGAIEKWESLKSRISDIVGGIRDFVIETVGGLVERAIELFGRLIAVFAGGGANGNEGGNAFNIDFSGLITSLMTLREQWTLTKTHIETILESLRVSTMTVFDAMKAHISAHHLSVIENTNSSWSSISTFLSELWNAIGEMHTTWRAGLLEATTLGNAAILADITTSWTIIKDWYIALWSELGTVYGTWLETRLTATTTNNASIRLNMIMVWSGIKQFLKLTWDELLEYYSDKLLKMLATTRQVNQWILQDHQNAWPKIVSAVVGGMRTMESAVTDLMAQIRDIIQAALAGLVSAALSAGQALGNAFAQGIWNSIPAIRAAADAAAEAARVYLPSSDAKTGPLSDLTESGRALPTMLAHGMRSGVRNIRDAAVYLAQNAQPPTGPDMAWDTPLPQWIPRPVNPPAISDRPGDKPKPGGDCTTINITINNPTGQPSEASIMQALKRLAAVGVLHPVAGG